MEFSTKTILISVFFGTVLWVEGCSSSLHDTASEGNIEKMRTLIEQGADVNAKYTDDLTLLHYAAGRGNKDCVELLLAKGAAVDAKGGKAHTNPALSVVTGILPAMLLTPPLYETPLHRAAEQGYPEVIEILLAHGADINAKNAEGETPLLLASGYLFPSKTEYTVSGKRIVKEHHSEETIKLLLERGADVNIAGGKVAGISMKWTPLHYAVREKNKEVTKLLLDRGANINAPDHVGYTPLHEAVMFGKADKELVKLLLDRGADVNAQAMGFWKETPLKTAKNKEIKELLRQYGAKE
jgi:ankyrin repeat protein